MAVLAASGRAVPLHACAVGHHGAGLVFTGPPDSGKTTMAAQWHRWTDAVALGDERVWLRRNGDGQYYIYGSPLPSTFPCSTSQGVPLQRIFLLQHGLTNRAEPSAGLTALVRLLRQTYPRLYRELGLMFPVDFCSDLVQQVPCHELDFTPDPGVVDYVLELN